MEKVYAELILKGRKTIEDVPQALREKVLAILKEKEVEGS